MRPADGVGEARGTRGVERAEWEEEDLCDRYFNFLAHPIPPHSDLPLPKEFWGMGGEALWVEDGVMPGSMRGG